MQTDAAIEKSLPHSLEAERAILGAILLENSLLDQANEILGISDFYLEGHRKIFSTMQELSSGSRPIDSLTLREELQKNRDMDAVGGQPTLLHCWTEFPGFQMSITMHALSKKNRFSVN